MTASSPEHWQAFADHMRLMAAKTGEPILRLKYLEMADLYDRIAKLEEERLARIDLPHSA